MTKIQLSLNGYKREKEDAMQHFLRLASLLAGMFLMACGGGSSEFTTPKSDPLPNPGGVMIVNLTSPLRTVTRASIETDGSIGDVSDTTMSTGYMEAEWFDQDLIDAEVAERGARMFYFLPEIWDDTFPDYAISPPPIGFPATQNDTIVIIKDVPGIADWPDLTSHVADSIETALIWSQINVGEIFLKP